MSNQPYQLLFVCLGNICRSPAAENIMKYLVEQRGLQDQVVCDSAGTSNYHVGSSPDQRMAATLAAQGIPSHGQARQFNPQDFEQFDLILVMDQENYSNILALDAKGEYRHKVKLVCNFCRNHRVREVPDPYYGGAEGFKYVLNLLLDACEGLLDDIVKQKNKQKG